MTTSITLPLPTSTSVERPTPTPSPSFTPLFYDRGGDDLAFLGTGHLPADFAIVGTYPGKARPGLQKRWPVGEGTYEWLARHTPRHARTYITNLIPHVTDRGNKEPLLKDIRLHGPALIRELKEVVRPRRILTMGDTVSKLLCGDMYKGAKDSHGTFFWNEYLEAWVVPTWTMARAYSYPPNRRSLDRDMYRFFHLPDPVYSQFEIVPCVEFLPEIPMGATVYFDIETTGLQWVERIISIGLSWIKGLTYILENPKIYELRELGRYLQERRVKLIGHNTTFDLTHLLRVTEGTWPTDLPYGDTMQMAYVRGEEQLGLKHLTVLHTAMPGNQGAGGFTDPKYLSEDVQSTRAIHRKFEDAEDTFIGAVLSRLVPVASAMRVFGVHVDRQELAKVKDTYEPSLRQLQTQLDEEAPINWNSNQQVVALLQHREYTLTELTRTGKPSLAEGALTALAETYSGDPLLQTLLEYKSLQKIETSFLKPYERFLADDGFFHPRLKLTGARTGRFSMSDPNLQQVPRVGPIKRIFTSRWPGGSFGLVDLAGAELRIAALMSGDEAMVEAILSGDIHLAMASRLYRLDPKDVTPFLRKRSKAITFGLLYGGSAFGLAKRLGIETKQVEDILRIFRREFPKLMAYLDYCRDVVVPRGYIQSPFGKVRYLHDLIEMKGPKDAYRKAANTPIQGTASECMGHILAESWQVAERLRLHSRPICLVHDSMECDIYPGEEEAFARIVQDAFNSLSETPLTQFPLFNNPLPLIGELTIGKSWAEVESTNENYAKSTNRYYACTSYV